MKILWILLFMASSSIAAVTATTVFECRSTGTAGNLNGCLFDSAYSGIGTDYSLQNTYQSSGAILSSLDGLGPSSCTVTSALYDFSSTAWVGNGLHVTAGTNWTPSWHVILATATGSDLVVTGPCGTANNITLGTFYIGGACSLGSTLDDDLFESGVAGNKFWIKNGNFTAGETILIGAAGGT